MTFDESVRVIFEKRLLLTQYLTNSEKEDFLNQVIYYLLKKRVYLKSLDLCVENTVLFFKDLNFNMNEIIKIIRNYTAIIHINKKDLFIKYLILATLNEENETSVRRALLLNYPKYYVMGLSTLYARMMHLKTLGSKYLKKWYLLKMTNKEFEKHFEISQEKLLELYPYNKNTNDELLSWPDNKKYQHLKSKILES